MPQESEAVLLIGKLQELVDHVQKSTNSKDQDQLPIVMELRQQVTSLQTQLVEKDRFIISFQQQVIKHLMNILSASGTLTGLSYRRLKPKLDDLERFVVSPETYIKHSTLPKNSV